MIVDNFIYSKIDTSHFTKTATRSLIFFHFIELWTLGVKRRKFKKFHNIFVVVFSSDIQSLINWQKKKKKKNCTALQIHFTFSRIEKTFSLFLPYYVIIYRIFEKNVFCIWNKRWVLKNQPKFAVVRFLFTKLYSFGI